MVDEGSVLARYVGVATLVYGALGLGAFALAHLADDASPVAMEAALGWDRVERLALSLALGLGLGVLVVLATRVLVRRARWARQLHSGFRELLGPLSGRQILFLAVLSGVAEELFFRGALMPLVGFWVSSALFGLLHIGPGRRFAPWTAWAVAMGLAFGAIYWLTGELVGCVVAHVLVNYENMHFIEAHDPAPEARVIAPEDPSLIGRRRHRSGGFMHP